MQARQRCGTIRIMKVIFAQGNPEPQYVRTRHNTGFIILDALAEREELKWRTDGKFNAQLAEYAFNGEKVLLVKPLSYYNETGRVARKIIDFYKLDPEKDVLVLHDELALPFGTIRIRQKGSDAGNNGIKSLNAHIGDTYWRIRIGIAPRSSVAEPVPAAAHVSFVLSAFTGDEARHLLDALIPAILTYAEAFLGGTLSSHSENNKP